jgi:hypothetical protein
MDTIPAFTGTSLSEKIDLDTNRNQDRFRKK